VGCVLLLSASSVWAQDWPQWRGPNRDGKAVGFTAPRTWPKELTQKWKVSVGDGVATPALAGDKLYVFSRQGGNEVIRCLDAATGKEVWKDEYESGPATGAAGGFPGPRGSPTVADGKVVTLGVRGILSCLDAATGKVLWRKDDFKSWPQFYTSSSPIVDGGLCIAQLGGGRGGGGVVAYNLTDGSEKWKWTGDGPAYASPSLLTLGDDKVLVAETAGNVVALSLTDGKLLWRTPFAPGGGGFGRGYNAASPMVEGQTLFLNGSGRGVKALKVEKGGEGLAPKEVWSNMDNSTQYNTPVLKDGLVYGVSSSNVLFCIDAGTGKTTWKTDLPAVDRRSQGYASVVDAGSVLFALNPSTQLVVFEPSGKEFKQVAKYKVGDAATYAYPIISGNRVFIKDRDSVILWTMD
jgi:outer membrane protein assembly factor BamB